MGIVEWGLNTNDRKLCEKKIVPDKIVQDKIVQDQLKVQDKIVRDEISEKVHDFLTGQKGYLGLSIFTHKQVVIVGITCI